MNVAMANKYFRSDLGQFDSEAMAADILRLEESERTLKARAVKVFVIIDHGCVSGVYSDSNAVEVEIIDLDGVDDEKEAALAEERAQEVMAEYAEVG